VPEQIIAAYLQYEEAGWVDHEGDEIARDRESLDAYARRLFHDGMSEGWIYMSQN
jgi:hypothetical protein